MKKLSLGLMALATGLSVFQFGCSTPARYAESTKFYAAGDYAKARDVFKDQKRDPEKDGQKFILDDLMLGSANHALQDHDASIKAFDTAEAGMAVQDEASAAGKGAKTVGAVLSNDNALPYKVQQYDKIMANTYKALDQLAKGDKDAARIEFNRALERQRNCGIVFAKQIKAEEEKAAAERQGDGKDEKASEKNALTDELKKTAMETPEMKEKMAAFDNSLASLPTYAGFTVPYASFMHGLFLTLMGEDSADFESARKLFEEVNKVAPSAAVTSAYNLADGLAGRKMSQADAKNLVWVVFENGMGPSKEEFRFDIPVPNQGSISMLSFAMPTLKTGTPAYPYLSIHNKAAELAKSSMLCDMSAVVNGEFKTMMPAILSRNITSACIKLAAQIIAVKIAKEQGGALGGLGAGIAGSALSAASAKADLRIWNQLPANFQVAAFDRPESGEINFQVPGNGSPIANVKLPDTGASIVYVKIPAPGVKPVVNVFASK